MHLRFDWDKIKRLKNIKDHGLDFLDAPQVFTDLTVTFEDDRFDYGERRMVTLGFLRGTPVSIVHAETDSSIHLISFRKATRREAEILYANI